MITLPWQVYLCLWMKTTWRWRYAILALLVLMPVLGMGAGLVRPKMYETSMTILIQESAKHNPFLEDLAVETRVGDRIAALEALLHSRHILVGVAKDLELVNEETPADVLEKRIDTLSRSLSVRLIGDELVELRFRQSEIDGIDKVLFAVAQRFMEKVLAPERSSIAGSQQFLEEQIEGSAKALAEAEAALGDYMSQHAANLPDLHAGNVRRLADMKLALSERVTALEGAQARYQSLITRLAQNNPVIAQIEHQIVDISSELAALRSRYTDQHSAVQAAQRKLVRLTAERDGLLKHAPELTETEVEDLWTAAARAANPDSGLQVLLVSQIDRLHEAKAELADLERQSDTLRKEINELDRLVLSFGSMETQLRRLESDVNVKRDVHDSLRERAEMARVTGALGVFEAPERVKVIDRPTVPTRPIGFSPVIFALLGLVAGVFAAIGLVALSEATESSIRTRAELARLSGLPVITRIPHLPSVLHEIEGNQSKWRKKLTLRTKKT